MTGCTKHKIWYETAVCPVCQKEAEIVVLVARIDQLSQQLEGQRERPIYTINPQEEGIPNENT